VSVRWLGSEILPSDERSLTVSQNRGDRQPKHHEEKWEEDRKVFFDNAIQFDHQIFEEFGPNRSLVEQRRQQGGRRIRARAISYERSMELCGLEVHHSKRLIWSALKSWIWM
jgi:hypothetical protein